MEKIRVVRTIGGRRRIPENEIKRILGLKEERAVFGYARASSTQRDDLERQKQLVVNYAKENNPSLTAFDVIRRMALTPILVDQNVYIRDLSYF